MQLGPAAGTPVTLTPVPGRCPQKRPAEAALQPGMACCSPLARPSSGPRSSPLAPPAGSSPSHPARPAHLNPGMAQKVQAWLQPSATRRYAVCRGVRRWRSHSGRKGMVASPTWRSSVGQQNQNRFTATAAVAPAGNAPAAPAPAPGEGAGAGGRRTCTRVRARYSSRSTSGGASRMPRRLALSPPYFSKLRGGGGGREGGMQGPGEGEGARATAGGHVRQLLRSRICVAAGCR